MLLLIFFFDLCYSRGTTWSNYPELCGSFDELGTLLGIEPHKVPFSSVELGTLLPSLSLPILPFMFLKWIIYLACRLRRLHQK